MQLADKLDSFAEKLQKQIAELRREGRTNTKKQQCQQSQRLYEAHNKENALQACQALAKGFRDGTASTEFEYFKHLSKIEVSTRVGCTRKSHGFNDLVYPDRENFSDKSDLGRKLQAFVFQSQPDSEREKREAQDELRRKLDAIKAYKIDGFFPSPTQVIERLCEGLDLKGKKILEPSAGIGSIADYVRDKGASVLCVEKVPQLSEILKMKDHQQIGADFLSLKPVPIFDIVLMNPPFEKNAAPTHVLAATRWLKPNGSLRAVMPSSALSYGSSRVKFLNSFDDWVDSIPGSYYDPLPADSFKGAFCSTGVGTAILCIDQVKPFPANLVA